MGIWFFILLQSLVASAQNDVVVAHPQTARQVVVSPKVNGGLGGGEVPSSSQKVACKGSNLLRGSVVATAGSHSLVVFNEREWRSACGALKGYKGRTMAWVESDELKPTRQGDRDIKNFGDRCQAYELLEKTIPAIAETAASSQAACPDGNCEPSSTIADVAKEILDLPDIHTGNLCFIEKSDQLSSANCSFTQLLKEARNCSDGKRARICPQNQCITRMKRIICEASPWRGMGLKDRFESMVNLARKHTERLKVDFRAIPCIAGVETIPDFEPLAKDLGCVDPKVHPYHGLGQIKDQTLNYYLSTSHVVPTKKTDQNGRVQTSLEGPFRSTVPEVDKPTMYTCPEKMHDALAASVELQIEVIAYTLADKLNQARGNELTSFINYNGSESVDRDGRAHRFHYGEAVMACVRCLRDRMPAKPKGAGATSDPVECLGATLRNSKGGHAFRLSPTAEVYSAFESVHKNNCGGGKQ